MFSIILCGVDMSGQLYWNGISRNRPTHVETWDYAVRLDLIIQHLREERQLNIHSLSPTKLDIPVN